VWLPLRGRAMRYAGLEGYEEPMVPGTSALSINTRINVGLCFPGHVGSRPQNQGCNEDSPIGVRSRCNDSVSVESHKRPRQGLLEGRAAGAGGTHQKMYGPLLSMSSRRILTRSLTTIEFTNLRGLVIPMIINRTEGDQLGPPQQPLFAEIPHTEPDLDCARQPPMASISR